MILYSVEISLNSEVSDKWIQWMKRKHIPDVLKTNMFSNVNVFKNLDDTSNSTYTLQYELDNIEKYLNYKNKFSGMLQKDHTKNFKNQFSSKRTLFIKIPD
mgnify:CR=1 FL=1